MPCGTGSGPVPGSPWRREEVSDEDRRLERVTRGPVAGRLPRRPQERPATDRARAGPPGAPGRGRRWTRTDLPAHVAPLRVPSFRRYWGAVSVSTAGDGVLSVAVPIAAAVLLGAGPAQMGWLTALAWIPSVLFAIPAGGWVARFRHPLTPMIGADLVRFAVTASLPAAWWLGWLNLPALYALTAVVASASVLFVVADAALFPTLLDDDRLVAGQSLVYSARTVASVAGSGAGGLLVPVLSAPVAVAADALSYLWSAALLTRIDRPAARTPPPRTAPVSTTGLRFITASPALRGALGVTTTANFFNLMFHALLVLFLTRTLHLSAAVTGLVLGAEAAGALVGSMALPAVARRLGMPRSLVAGSLLSAASLTAVAVAAGPAVVVVTVVLVASFLSGVGRSVQDISVAATFVATVPVPLRTQVRGAYQTISFGVRPVGAVLGGLVGQSVGLRPAVVLATAGGLLAFLWALPSLRSPREQRGAPEA
ncbi:MFS transporter [Micromonospora haikouensis]|uniref:MFS transporter n=1 Tax=Micromonospora haikouensis TaxID=686309 RepID=UPI0033FDCBC3